MGKPRVGIPVAFIIGAATDIVRPETVFVNDVGDANSKQECKTQCYGYTFVTSQTAFKCWLHDVEGFEYLLEWLPQLRSALGNPT